MSRKHKRYKYQINIRPEVAGALYMIGLAGLLWQSHANLSVHVKKFAPIAAAVTLMGPAPTPSPTKPPAASPSPTPAAVPKRPVAYQPAPRKYVAPVTPAPDSSVSHLVAITSPPAGGSTGLGSGPVNGSSPAPSSTPQPAAYSYESYNWSGYLAAGGKFTGVRGSWVVPSVAGNGRNTTMDAAWIGIGGVTNSDLIQVGTTETVSRSGRTSYNAFYELLPASETPVPNMVVGPGDAISADISQTGAGDWLITISDTTRNETFTITVPYTSSYSTAEWIEEDPSFSSGGLVPFDNFGSIDFSNCTTTQNGASQTIYSSGGQAIIMVNSSGQKLATPSVLTGDGAGFRVSGG
jgi:hypothetical protein